MIARLPGLYLGVDSMDEMLVWVGGTPTRVRMGGIGKGWAVGDSDETHGPSGSDDELQTCYLQKLTTSHNVVVQVRLN